MVANKGEAAAAKPPSAVVEIARRSAAGGWARFDDETIDASWIRRLAIETWPPDDELGRACPREPQALRIEGLKLKGTLDLRDCRGPAGEGCRALILKGCEILGDPAGYDDLTARPEPALDLRHARVSRLKLVDCKIAVLDLSNAELLSTLRIESLAGLSPAGQCWVKARELHIRGSIVVKGTTLRISQAAQQTHDSSDYALELVRSRISGSVTLVEGFIANGGVSLSSCRIGGDLWAYGATLRADGDSALTCQRCRVDGLVGLFCPEGVQDQGPFRAEGKVDLYGMEVAGSFHLNSAELEDLRAPFLVVGQDLVCVSGDDGRFKAQSVDIVGSKIDRRCTIQGDLESLSILNSRVRSSLVVEGCKGAVDLSGTEVKGQLYLQGAAGEADGTVAASPIRVDGNATLGGDLGKEIDLRGASFRRNLVVNPKGSDLLAQGTNVDGHARLYGDLGNRIDLRRARFRGDLDVDPKGSDLLAQEITVDGVADLGGSYSSRLLITGGQFRKDLTLSVKVGSPVRANETIVDLENVEVERNLRLDRIEFQQLVWESLPSDPQVRARPLDFYPGWRLAECLVSIPGQTDFLVFSFLYREPSGADSEGPFVFLDGTSPPIHKLNRDGAIRLDTDERRRDYLRFFCDHVWGSEGPFTLVEYLSSLPKEAVEHGVEVFPVQRRETTDDEQRDSWPYEAVVWYGSHLFRADFRILRTGKVTMEDDEQLQEKEVPQQVVFEKPVRRFRATESRAPTEETRLWPQSPAVQDPPPRSVWRDLDPGEANPLLQQLRLHHTGRRLIHLRRCRAGAFYRVGKISGAPEVSLDGFEYGWVESSEPFPITGTARSQFGEAAAPEPSVTHALKWLAKLLRGKSSDEGKWQANERTSYTPHPFEQAAKVLRRQGNWSEAREITLERLRLERKIRFPRSLELPGIGKLKIVIGKLKVVVGKLKPLIHSVARLFLYLLDLGFGYALKPARAIGTFLAMVVLGCLLVAGGQRGWPGISSAQAESGPVLVVKVTGTARVGRRPDRTRSAAQWAPLPAGEVASQDPPPSRADPGGRSTLRMPRGLATEVPCGSLVSAPLYALDVFVPFLDLHQESRCTISARPEAAPWRWGFALYRAAGWLVTSLLALTLTKAVLRHVER